MTLNGPTRFGIGITLIAAVWLLVLPALGRVPSIRAKIDEETANGIHPDAMFYTDLERLPEFLTRRERR